jgi:hypothetical protein
MEFRFAADRMLGRLARMLRLLGYDTLYSPTFTPSQLQEIARPGDRIVLTRGDVPKRFPSLPNVYSVKSEDPPEQLRDVVEHFRLDTRTGLWTRCTLCNAPIEKVEKQQVEDALEPKILQLYQEFFRCTGCGHIYWRGSHVDRITKNLERMLGLTGNE